ncbi:MAG: hypothetical protein JSS60_08885 [Verrucomicrobia bacterium]|nr:hypothetical protein [Verrucomicrobiota bacterium]
MNSIDPRQNISGNSPVSGAMHPTVAMTVRRASTGNSVDTFSSSPTADIKIEGFELAAKSAVALTLGIAPFAVSKFGEFVAKACAALAKHTHAYFSTSEGPGRGIGFLLRAALGIPAVIGGVMLFGGAVAFSKAQALVWGQALVEHPQEERVNTQLARYGAGPKPREDFGTLINGFFSFGEGVATSLEKMSDFQAT